MGDTLDVDMTRSLVQLAPEAIEEARVEEAAEAAVFRAANMPLRRLQPEHLLLLLGQGVALDYVVPLALIRLADSPLIEAHSHPGDLLGALLLTDTAYWRAHEAEWNAAMDVLDGALSEVALQLEEEQPLTEVFGDDFAAALMHFQGIHGGGGHG